MIIRVPTGDLKTAMNTAFAATATDKNRAVLQCVKLTASEQGVDLTGTNTELVVVAEIQTATNSGNGEILLPPVSLKIINELPATDHVTLETFDTGTLIITGGMGRFRLSTQDPADYPPGSFAPTGPGEIEVDGEQLAKAIARVLPCTDPDSTKYAMGSIKLEFGLRRGPSKLAAHTLTLITTDGRRLAWQDLPATLLNEDQPQDGKDHWEKILLPAAAAKVLMKVAKEFGKITLCPQASTLQAHTSHVSMSCRLTEGRFPNWRKVIPDARQTIEIPVGAFAKSIRAAAAAAETKDEAAELIFENVNDEGSLSVSVQSEVGSGLIQSGFPAPVQDFKTRLCTRFLMDALSAMPADDLVEMQTGDVEDGAVIFHNVVTRFSAVIMPLVNNEAAKK